MASPAPSFTPLELSLPLHHSPGTALHMHLSALKPTVLLFLSTASTASSAFSASTASSAFSATTSSISVPGGAGENGSLSSLGSFIYALPSRTDPKNILTTPLYTRESSVDFATRVARALARRTGAPVYVGAAVSFADAGRGRDGDGEGGEEAEALGKVVEIVMERLRSPED